MIQRLPLMWPEILLFAATCVVMVIGLSGKYSVRRLCGPICLLALLGAGVLAIIAPDAAGALPNLPRYGKGITAAVGALLLLLLNGVADREVESSIAAGRASFDPLRTVRAEFYAFFLFSITGLMLCASADNLIWLFLALELTSLPTYVMVAISSGEGRGRERAMEAAVKYFFLGAMGAAIFLFGFAFIYGGTGSTDLGQIRETLHAQAAAGGISAVALTGMLMAVLGLCFKIAAVPMHFYTPDVYQGAASPVTAMLAFVPKAAGFFALMLLLAAVGWGAGGAFGPLPSPLMEVLTLIAILTMTIGNVLALLQNSVKRVLAYSSIAHSGYMLVGLVSGPNQHPASNRFADNGLSAVLFYLLIYGITSVGAFAVLASLERRAGDGRYEEADDFADIKGLRVHHPSMAWILALSALGLMGFPPLVGFFAKIPLFTSSWAAGQWGLLLVLAINSAIGAYYYLRIVYVALLDSPDAGGRAAQFQVSPFNSRLIAGVLSVAAVVVLVIWTPAPLAELGGSYSALPFKMSPHADAAPLPHP
jgi:NADH-quinone oxidoreductase subunit N